MQKYVCVSTYPSKKKKPLPKNWKAKEPPYTVGQDGFTVSYVEFDKCGWADVNKYLPLPYEMVDIMTTDHMRTGWWNGLYWESLRLKSYEKILKWKAIKNETSLY